MHGTSTGKTDRRYLRAFFTEVRSITRQLCEPLEIEDYIPQPGVDVSPPKWNIAHTTWFFEEMVLKQHVTGYKVFDEQFGFLFNSYYNSIGKRTLRDHRGNLSRPTVKQVFAYRKYVDEQMDRLLSETVTPEVSELVTLGLNHEQQHQELFLTDLKYTLSLNPLFPVYRDDFAPVENAETGTRGFMAVKGGLYEIGHEGDGFCFDNELGRHTVYLNDFEISSRLVTNAEYAAFIEAGGYTDFRLWHSEGWDWINQNEVSAPLYWHKRSDGWRHYTLAGLRPLPPRAPVCHISFYEASAFAEWTGARLPTEFEWEAACSQFDWGKRWEWTGSAYLPYPGFAKQPGAVGEYNGKFMINQMVLRGASVVTPAGHSRPSYRNFFHPHLRWQFTGLRLTR
jgi:ergothioneine biosynthesis protein EgtB